jgi:hypothetical protein
VHLEQLACSGFLRLLFRISTPALPGGVALPIVAALGKHDPHTCSSLTMAPLVIGLFVVYYGLYSFAPEMTACALALVYPKGWMRR